LAGAGASAPASICRVIARTRAFQLTHPRQLDRVRQRQTDHRKRAETHRVDDELRPLRRQDIGIDLDPADRTEQRL
jgi:hypothetical protein